ncbi:MAG: hypothetical protein RL556_131 [Actinomycetota bacterium]|jgi:heme exporter protein D
MKAVEFIAIAAVLLSLVPITFLILVYREVKKHTALLRQQRNANRRN